jgi:hypothetical protein
MPLGGLVGGAMVTVIGLQPTLVAMGLVYFATTLAPFVFPSWRGMERTQPDT